LGRLHLIVGGEVGVLPAVVRRQEVPGLFVLGAEPIAPSVVIVDIEAMGCVGLCDRAMVADDRHVFVVVVGRAVAQVVAAGDHDAGIRERIDDDDLVVNDGVSRLIEFRLPLPKGVALGHAAGVNDAIVLRNGRIALLMFVRRSVAVAADRRLELARRVGRSDGAAHEQGRVGLLCASAIASTMLGFPGSKARKTIAWRALAMMSKTSARSGGVSSSLPTLRERACSVLGENHKSTSPLPSSSGIGSSFLAFSSRNSADCSPFPPSPGGSVSPFRRFQ